MYIEYLTRGMSITVASIEHHQSRTVPLDKVFFSIFIEAVVDRKGVRRYRGDPPIYKTRTSTVRSIVYQVYIERGYGSM